MNAAPRHSRHPLLDWHVYQGQTNDCGPSCVTIVANALRNAPVTSVPVVAQGLLEARPLPGRIRGWATFPWGMVRTLRRLGFQARWRMGVQEERLVEIVEGPAAGIVIVGQPLRFEGRRWRGWSHYEVLYGWDVEGRWGFVDPARPTERAIVWQPASDFRRQWGAMGRQLIEVWV